MPNLEKEVVIKKPSPAPANCGQMKGRHEPGVVRFLQGKFPNALIEHESREFRITLENGEQRSTIPDLRIVWANGREVFVELTTMILNGTDPKARQKQVMSHFPEVRYVPLYGQTLARMQKKWGIGLLEIREDPTPFVAK